MLPSIKPFGATEEHRFTTALVDLGGRLLSLSLFPSFPKGNVYVCVCVRVICGITTLLLPSMDQQNRKNTSALNDGRP
jgi:hypothetical protein